VFSLFFWRSEEQFRAAAFFTLVSCTRATEPVDPLSLLAYRREEVALAAGLPAARPFADAVLTDALALAAALDLAWAFART